MTSAKGTEFALCLNSANRDKNAFPETNDFTLDLKDRFDMQMMVLGSFEFPFFYIYDTPNCGQHIRPRTARIRASRSGTRCSGRHAQ